MNSILNSPIFIKHTFTFCEPTKVGIVVSSNLTNFENSPNESWILFTIIPI